MTSPGWLLRCASVAGHSLISLAILFPAQLEASFRIDYGGGSDDDVTLAPVGLAVKCAGTYLALLNGSVYEERGYFRMTLNSRCNGSAVIKIGNQRAQTIRIFGPKEAPGNSTGQGVMNIAADSKGISLAGKLVRQPDGDTIFEGRVTDKGRSIPVIARTTGRTDHAIQSGFYTLALTIPTASTSLSRGSAGAGTIRVSKTGSLRSFVKLADGQSFTQGTYLLKNGAYLLWGQARRDRAQIAGTVEFSNQTQSDLSGNLDRILPDPTEQTNGSAQLQLVGSRYYPLERYMIPSLTTSWLIQIEGPNESYSVTNKVFSPPRSVMQTRRIAGGNVSLRHSNSTGILSGSYRLDGESNPRPLFGVLLQKINTGAGFADLPTGNGFFTLIPSEAISAP